MQDETLSDGGQLGEITEWQRTNQCCLCDREEVTEIRVRPTGPNMELQRWGFCAICANDYDERMGVYMDAVNEARETYRRDHNDVEALYSAAELMYCEKEELVGAEKKPEVWTGGGELWCRKCAKATRYNEVVPARAEDFDGTPMCAQCGRDLS